MSAIVYPATLPTPTGIEIADTERRALEMGSGAAPGSARALQRDYAATAGLRWVLSAPHYAAWQAWWELALCYGGAWFSAPLWPFPWGQGAVLQFQGEPVVRHLGRGIREVQASAQVRGAGQAPVQPAQRVPLSLVHVDTADLADLGAELLAMTGLVTEIDDTWHRVNAAGTDLELLGAALQGGAPINPTRGSLPCGAVQFRGAADTAGSLGRLGVVINGDNNTAAAARLAAGLADRISRVIGSSTAGYAAVLPWAVPIELVHIGQLSMGGTYTVVDEGDVSAAASEFMRLTFDESDNIVALLLEEGPPTNYAGVPGTGSARMVRVRGLSGSVA
jgi:hypothetical protein